MTGPLAFIKRCNRYAAILVALCVATPASAACTIDDIRTCTQMDPAAAERLLLADIGDGRNAEALYRLGIHYWTAPEVFRDPVSAVWYVQRAAGMDYGPAVTALADMQAGPDPLEAAATANRTNLFDPPSTLTGNRLDVEEVIAIAYEAGFVAEGPLLAAVATAVAESSLWTSARNWKPEHGYRPIGDEVAVRGPETAWLNGRQMHSDRGLWQISSFTWANLPDLETDDPLEGARAAFALSHGGTNFDAWDSFRAGRAQRHYDRSIDGWPPLRPLVQQFLAAAAEAEAQAPPVAEGMPADGEASGEPDTNEIPYLAQFD